MNGLVVGVGNRSSPYKSFLSIMGGTDRLPKMKTTDSDRDSHLKIIEIVYF